MPTKPSKKNDASAVLLKALDRNIKTLLEIERQLNKNRTFHDRVADWITSFSGTTSFFLLHVLWFTFWLLANTGKMGIAPFDPFPYGLLTTIVSLEAIFLSTFILISQNRMSQINDQRADLDLQVNLLAEHELTRALKLVDAIADHLKLPAGKNKELKGLEIDATPEMFLKEMSKMRKKMKP